MVSNTAGGSGNLAPQRFRGHCWGAQWCQALSAPHSASQRDAHSARGPAVVPGNAPTPALNLGPNWASHDAIRHSPSSTVQAPNHWAFFCPSSWNGMDPHPPHVRCKVLRSLPQCPCRCSGSAQCHWYMEILSLHLP